MKMEGSISNIIKLFSIGDIEKSLVYTYITKNNIDISKSQYLTEYISDRNCIESLDKQIDTLNHTNIEDLINDMELLIPSEDKSLNGAFFTPCYIVDYIIKTINPEYNDKIIDLSCGSGAFIIGLLKYFKLQYNKTIKDCINENIFGADILKYNVDRCKLLILLYALKNNEILDITDINIINTDSLKYAWKSKFDVVVGNPPYVKFQDLNDDARKFLFNNYTTTKLGTYNLYFAFFELGYKLLNKNGKLGYITPNNYFTSLSGECLRKFLQEKQSVKTIIDFNSTKVFSVQTYTSITFLTKEKNKNILYDRIKEGELPEKFLQNISLTENYYSDLSTKKWRLLCGNERQNISKIEHSGTPIGHLFDICVGIATLKDSEYTFIPQKEDEVYYYIDNFKIEKQITRPLVKISEMKRQEDVEINKKRIIFPYKLNKNNNYQEVIQEEELKKLYPYCYNYLLSKRDKLEYRGKGKHPYEPFYIYGRSQALNRMGTKLLTPTFSKSPRFLVDKHSDGFFTNGYGIYPRKQLDNALFNHYAISLEENFDVALKILNSSIMNYYIKITSVSIEGGYPCYQKNFIERFSIPNLTETQINEIRKINDHKKLDSYLCNLYQINLL